MNQEMTETKIYIGLNDGATHSQRFEIEQYKSLLKQVCRSYHVPFSVSLTEGGYFHEDGTYTEENTLVLSLINIAEETVQEIAKDLCVFFHQESVLITCNQVRSFFIRERL